MVVLPKEEKLETKLKEVPDFNPFLTRGTVSLSVNGDKQYVSILRDTGAGQSIVRKGILPLLAETYTGMDVLFAA